MTDCPVGIDIVDLNDKSVQGKHRNARFLKRVLAPSEQRLIVSASDPGRMLWICWAAKEAAYKALCKRRKAPVFSHAKYVLELGTGATEAGGSGIVTWENHDIPVDFQSTGQFVLASTKTAPGSNLNLSIGMQQLGPAEHEMATDSEWLSRHFSAREAVQQLRPDSVLARYYLKLALADESGYDPSDYELVAASGGRFPELHRSGEPAAADVSISHHGEWVAWAFSYHQPASDR